MNSIFFITEFILVFFVFTYVDISLGVVVVVQVLRNHCSSCFVHFTLYNAEAIFWKYTIYLWTTKESLDSIIIVFFFWKRLQVPLNTDDVSGMVRLVKMNA